MYILQDYFLQFSICFRKTEQTVNYRFCQFHGLHVTECAGNLSWTQRHYLIFTGSQNQFPIRDMIILHSIKCYSRPCCILAAPEEDISMTQLPQTAFAHVTTSLMKF